MQLRANGRHKLRAGGYSVVAHPLPLRADPDHLRHLLFEQVGAAHRLGDDDFAPQRCVKLLQFIRQFSATALLDPMLKMPDHQQSMLGFLATPRNVIAPFGFGCAAQVASQSVV